MCISTAKTLAPVYYTCAKQLAAEMEAVFGRCWLNVASADRLSEVGAYKSGMVGRQPYLVTRSAQGLRASDNV